MAQITIRRATSADYPEWLRMRQALWPDEIEFLSFAEMDEMLADPMLPVFLAVRLDGNTSASLSVNTSISLSVNTSISLSVKLGGFLEAGTRKYAEGGNTSPVGYIEGWYVDPDLRKQGVGAALVRAAEDWARSQGLTEMGSDTWLDNEDSIRAHGRLGYLEQERLVHFLKKL